jgi:CheY-like chemotaxis protein
MVTESHDFELKASSVLSHYKVERSVTRNRGAMETMLRSDWSTHSRSLMVVADAKSHWAREAILKETLAPVLIVHEEQVAEELAHFLDMPDRRMGCVSIARGPGKKEVRQDFMKPLVRNWFIDALLVEDDLEKGVEFAAMLHELGCHTEVIELSTFATRNRSIIEPQIIFFSLANALSPIMITSWVMARYRHRQGIPLIGLIPAELGSIRNEFLDMGMDDAITTPVTKEDIRGILARHVPVRSGESSL